MVKITKSGLFLGEYRHRIDEKNRVALPKRIRIEIEGFEVVLARGFEPCISGFDKKRWQESTKPQLEIPFHEEKGRRLRRQLFSQAIILELDSQGRVVIPETLAGWAQIKDKNQEVAIVGVGDHFEIWQEENWKKYSQF